MSSEPVGLRSLVPSRESPAQEAVKPEHCAGDTGATKRAWSYIDQMPGCGVGGRGDLVYKAACRLRDFAVPAGEAVPLLHRFNHAKCTPPLPDAEVVGIFENVQKYAKGERGSKVQCAARAPVSCGLENPEGVENIVDPGPTPVELLRAPGFISETMDYCLETAPYPNQTMAFCGGVGLQAFVAGRKVRDPGDNRTNLYLLGLAHSGAGKDWPRKLNVRIAYEVGLSGGLGERFASGEGIQDALFQEPTMLFQTDEIDGMLQAMSKSKEARHESIMNTLLTMYSSANSVYLMRRKANEEEPGEIDQPCLSIFGTAIPKHYYEALSDRMLSNGFFARMLIFECQKRGPGQEPKILVPPKRLVETARWWANFSPAAGNLSGPYPQPLTVEQTAEAQALLEELREEAEAEYSKAEDANDPVATTVWSRVSEHARKLSLVYAVSESHQSPEIGKEAVQWAGALVMHQARRMLFMAQAHVADSEFDALCLKCLRKLKEAPGRELPHSVLMKRMKMDSKSFRDLTTTLEERGDIVSSNSPTPGRTGKSYTLVEWR